ncbi:helix-turn-helix domain-containing protein [Mycolicibacterium sp. CBMA 226]|uniref:helix-turn-helix domain-containing protein n=1 Tax=Mycolicibacterium sp. CBMA 226 TaxID=2606611 RepID=UPI0012DE0C0C|nr:helix-turn-helix domain-containing protein [Mycolicibacterium sp. CBMA 226]MUL76438.1 helix-turn-helix domain-containing protein [Mycolicibacterium sp. CBMA 226]
MVASIAADPWLTRAEVSERLRIPVKTLATWASKRRGPRYARFGRHCRYRLSDLIAWEADQFGSTGMSRPSLQ